MTKIRAGSMKGFLVKVRINIQVFAKNEKRARKEAMREFERQMCYTGYSESEYAGRAIGGTFVDADGNDTFIDSIEELVIAPERAHRRNGVWARKEAI